MKRENVAMKYSKKLAIEYQQTDLKFDSDERLVFSYVYLVHITHTHTSFNSD